MRFFISLILCVFSLHAGLLTQDEIETFYNQGFYVKRQVIKNVEKYDSISKQVLLDLLEELENEKYPFSSECQFAYLNGAQIAFLKQEHTPISILRIVGCGSYNREFLNLLNSDTVIHTFFDLLSLLHAKNRQRFSDFFED